MKVSNNGVTHQAAEVIWWELAIVFEKMLDIAHMVFQWLALIPYGEDWFSLH